jgi:hypothetical protein
VAYKVKYEKVLPRTVLPLSKADWKNIGGIVKVEVQNGMAAQVQVDGRAYEPLKPATIKQKIRDGYSVTATHRLIRTQNLMDNQVVTPSVDRVELTLGPTREYIGYIQQEAPNPGNVATKFFGISENCAQRILAYVDQQVTKWLSRKS